MARRRSRVVAVAAVVIVIMLYRVAQNSSVQEPPTYLSFDSPPSSSYQGAGGDAAEKNRVDTAQHPNDSGGRSPFYDDVPLPSVPVRESATANQDESSSEPLQTNAAEAVPQTLQEDVRVKGPLRWKNPPNGVPHKDFTVNQISEPHWQPVPEHFPLPAQSIIPLPTGKPKRIPKVQHDFGPEAEDAKAERMRRLGRVKTELQRTWAGYRSHAWMHDELRPVSGQFRDPFCGWAATLVDTLDLLWIAGMKDDFDEAAKAVANIDFTTSIRRDIPVFETTIRYLGGLLAAYDVSGGDDGKYPVLLQKARELADILMGIFDTPNRMPVLYYRWVYDFASQPHRAGPANIAEMATLSLEFTRLAQLTHNDKYYDAIDRITNALIEFQDANLAVIPGLFPQDLDASGCNRTKDRPSPGAVSDEALQQVQLNEGRLPDPEGYKPTKAAAGAGVQRKSVDADNVDGTPTNDRLKPREVSQPQIDDRPQNKEIRQASSNPGRDETTPPLRADGKSAVSPCKPQGLKPSFPHQQSYHMGGAQDSAYEYFPKEYLLLGGQEDKYKKLHERTIEAVNKYLMYRPMVNDDGWDILFPARVTTGPSSVDKQTVTYEITHLTCFIGGMYGLGGRIFGREADVETAKKLTDGCVWAYQSMPAGIMPEIAQVMACPTLDRCAFNQGRWWDALDPHPEKREQEMQKWLARQQQRQLAADGQSPVRARQPELTGGLGGQQAGEGKNKTGHFDSTGGGEEGLSLGKRAVVPAVETEGDVYGSELPDSLRQKLKLGNAGYGAGYAHGPVGSGNTGLAAGSAKETEGATKDGGSDANPTKPPKQPIDPKPMTHEEAVRRRIKREKLPLGFTSIPAKSYILRPEAIESVWYMYRITGDRSWQDKGWSMFEAIVRATRSEFGNSAVDSVMEVEPKLKDQMESFWTAETLKYFFLLFSEPDVVSLDEWVLNTEAHPFRRPSPT